MAFNDRNFRSSDRRSNQQPDGKSRFGSKEGYRSDFKKDRAPKESNPFGENAVPNRPPKEFKRSFGSDSGSRGSFNRDDSRGPRKPWGEKRNFDGGNRDNRGGERREGGFENRERKPWGEKRSFGGGNRDNRGGERREGGFENRERKPWGEKRSFDGGNRENRGGERREGGFENRERKPWGEKRSFDGGNRENRGGERREGGFEKRERKPWGEKRSFDGGNRENRGGERREGGFENRERKPWGEKRSFDGGNRENRGGERREGGFENRERKPWGEKRSFDGGNRENRGGERREGGFENRERKPWGEKRNFDGPKRSFSDNRENGPSDNTWSSKKWTFGRVKPSEYAEIPSYDGAKLRQLEKQHGENSDLIRLNKYISNSGKCSRRDADMFIQQGQIMVNGKVITELGYKVALTDKVELNGEVLNPEPRVYLLLNKPKNVITTTEDPQERNTVLDIVKNATPYRIYPVGRLDRNTTGLLLLTNDGALAEKLSHPSFEMKKIYQVDLDKPLTEADYIKIKTEGVMLEDGLATVDDIEILSLDKSILGLEIHSGKNRIVRRIFAELGYEVIKLDRVMYASLTKKDIARGQWRFLTEEEVIRLKYFMK